ncbi:MAG: DUF4249 domain-containing protein [Ignavibacteriae bacterium]|nr:DUF4249 domain-containing protein [Ignavibacteriota bacterium]
MKNILLALAILALIGCEEIIELDLNSTNTEIIIEANLTNSLEKNFVKITESTDYFNPNTYQTISNVEVIIKENNGNSYTLEETAPGIYHHNDLIAIAQNQYTIEVNNGAKNYSANSFVPNTMEVDSLAYLLEERHFVKDKESLELHVFFQDRADQEDFARIVVYKNGKKIKNFFLYNDRLTNGNYIDYAFFNFRDEEFLAGDIITVELQSIDEATFDYFNTLGKALARTSGGPFGSAAPANPITNWNNNAFGYFSAFTISTSSIILE